MMNKKINFNVSQNWNKPIYVATQKEIILDDFKNEIIKYNEPIYLGGHNYQPIVGSDLYAYMSAYGLTKNKLVRLYLDIEYKDTFKENDVAYLYGITPTDELENGSNANYKVKTFIPQNTKIYVVFEEIIKE